jgi:uncharacterized protein (TIGR03067 family)
MYMRTCLVAVTLAAVVTAAPLPPKAMPKKPADTLPGLWEVLSVEGSAVLGSKPLRLHVKIEGEKWSFLRDDGTGKLTTSSTYLMALDARAAPIALDLKRTADTDPIAKGLIRVDGDRLQFIFTVGGLERPREVKLSGGREMLYTLKRVSKP